MEYKSKRHQQVVEDYEKNKPVVECLKGGEGETCRCDCSFFYDCWVKELDDQDKLQEAGRLEDISSGI